LLLIVDPFIIKGCSYCEPRRSCGEAGDSRGMGTVPRNTSHLQLSLFLAALDFTIATTALPTITTTFYTSTAYTWI